MKFKLASPTSLFVAVCLLSLISMGSQLAAQVALQGTVTNQNTGQPIAGVGVSNYANSGSPLTTTDANGNYTLTGSQLGGQGTGTLYFQLTGYYVTSSSYTITAEPTTVNASLLPGGTVLQGTISDASTQAGIVGASMVFFVNTSSFPYGYYFFATTGPGGQYSIDSSNFYATAASGFSVTSMSISAAGYFSASPASFSVNTPFPDTQNFSLVEATGVALQGTVTNQNTGQPIAGVGVTNYANSGSPLTTTDANGNYTLTGTQLGGQGTGTLYFQLTGYYVTSSSYTITAEPTTVNASLLPGGTVLQGTISDASTQAGIVGASMVFFVNTSSFPYGYYFFATTGPGGQYSIDSSNFYATAASGFSVTSMSISAAGYFSASPASFSVNTPFPDTQNFSLVEATGVALQGTVTNQNTGQPIAGVGVTNYANSGSPLTTTDANGNYTLTGTQLGGQGTGTLYFQLTGYYVTSSSYTITAEPTTVNASLLPGGTVLQGTISDASTQAGIVGASMVFFVNTSSFPYGYYFFATTGPGGQYSIDSSNFYATAASGFSVTSMSISAAGYFSASPASFSVNTPFPDTQNFSLSSTGVLSNITIATTPPGLTISVDGKSYVAPQVFQWNPSNAHTIATTTPQAASSLGTQYAFSSWSDGGALSHQIVVPSATTTYTASFNTQYQLTTAANPAEGGTITPSGWINAGTNVSIQATPSSGYLFTGFSGSLNGLTNPQTLLMSGPASVTANFSNSVSTTTTLSASPAGTSSYGEAVTFTATISSASGNLKTRIKRNSVSSNDVTGTVTWSSNTGCGTTTVTTGNPGVATCTTSTLPVGTDTVTGAYSGDSSNSASSGSFSQTVNQANSSVNVSSTLNPSAYGQAVSFTATVTGVTPTGTVQFNVDGSPVGSPVTLAGGSATSGSTSTLAVGTHTVTATYSGDSNNAGSTGTLASGQVVNSAGAIINITSSLNPSVYGQSVTFTATISGANGLLKRNAVKSQDVTGSVTWSGFNGPIICSESGTNTTPVTTGNPGTATCTSSALSASPGDLITGAYSGDSNHNPGTGSTQQTITQATSSTAVASSGSPTTYGQTVTFTATISGQYGPLTRKNGVKSQDLTGTVNWSTNTNCGTTNVTSGIATCTTTTLAGGTDSISATYSGDTNHSGSAGATTQVVNVATQTITFTVNAPASAAYNSQFTVAATGGGSGNPVLFTSAGSCTNVGATYTMTAGSGTCSVIANQSGNGNYSAAPTVTQSVNATLAVPTVSFTGAPASAPYLSTFTVAATTNAGVAATIKAIGSCTLSSTTVTIIKGTGTCTMTASWPATSNYTSATAKQTTLAVKATPVVTWTAPAPITYGTPLSATQLDATANVTGTFFYTPPAGKVLKAGTQTLSVKFTPTQSTNYNTVTATVQITVNKVGTTTTITSNTPNPSKTGQLVLVNYSVAQAITNPTKPTGKITVTATTGESCSASLVSGSGHCSIKFTTSGSRTLTASYPGDTNNNSSVSAGVTQTVN